MVLTVKYSAMNRFKDKDMQIIIGWILRTGVAVSMFIVIIGGILFVYHYGYNAANFSSFKGVPFFLRDIGSVTRGILELRSEAIIQLGIILLIATPVIRVLFSAIGFFIEKDYLYMAMTLIVLSIILFSMLSSHAG
jgi:uncharacterized membrane protein